MEGGSSHWNLQSTLCNFFLTLDALHSTFPRGQKRFQRPQSHGGVPEHRERETASATYRRLTAAPHYAPTAAQAPALAARPRSWPPHPTPSSAAGQPLSWTPWTTVPCQTFPLSRSTRHLALPSQETTLRSRGCSLPPRLPTCSSFRRTQSGLFLAPQLFPPSPEPHRSPAASSVSWLC